MRSASEIFPNPNPNPNHNPVKSDKPAKRSYVRPLLVAVLLLAVYSLMNWVPVEGLEAADGLSLDAVLFWCGGGLVTLACLAIAGRK